MAEGRFLVGRYRLQREQSGGWRATDQRDGDIVVVTKVATGVPKEAGSAVVAAAGQAAATAISALAGLAAQGVVVPREAIIDAGELWVVRPDTAGTTLAANIVDERRLARIGADVAGALAAAHAAGVVHGDVRAESVLVGPDGSAALAGFATVAPRDIAPDAPLPRHPEPELVPTQPAASPADVYALGNVLAEALARSGSGGERLNAVLRSMRAEFPDVRPTAWAVQQRLATIAEPGQALGGDEPTEAIPLPAKPSATKVETRRQPAPYPPTMAAWDAIEAERAERGSNRTRWLATVAAVLTIAALVASAFLMADRTRLVAGVAAAPAGVVPPPPSLLGNPRKADPCSLLDPVALRAYGPAEVLPSYGSAAACTAQISTGGNGYVLAAAVLQSQSAAAPYGTPTRMGELSIYRSDEYERDCQRTIVLPDQTRTTIDVTAYLNSPAPVCTIADAVTAHAATVIANRRVTERTVDVPANSLLTVKACDLLDTTALAAVPGLPGRRERGYNDWSCRWGVDPAFPDSPRVQVNYRNQIDLSTGDRAAPVAGRSTATFPSTNLPSCEVWVAQRSFTAPSGAARVELVSLYVYLGGTSEATGNAACTTAVKLAGAMSPKLPPV